MATKLTGATVLAATLQPATLRFLVLFSSVSGRFGNRGQADYAAANEGLNKLAQQLNAEWPGRVVAINWGPWLTTSASMVSAEVQRQFAERGVELIPLEVGCRKLDQELTLGRKDEVEVVIAGMRPVNAAPVPRATPAPSADLASLPLLLVNSRLSRPADDAV